MVKPGGNRTVYVRAEDRELWDKAQAIAEAHGVGFSNLVIRLLTEFIDGAPQCCGIYVKPDWKCCPQCGKEIER